MRQVRTIAFAVEMFDLDNQARRLTSATRRNYLRLLSQFSKWCEQYEITNLDDVKPTTIRQYLANLAARGLSTTSQHNQYRTLRTFFGYCVRDELLALSPLRTMRAPQTETKLPKVFNREDLDIIFAACQTTRDKAICLFLLDSGLRAAELCSLNVDDVDVKTGAVLVEKGKQQKQRVVYVGATVRKQYRRYLVERGNPSRQDPAFVSERGGARLTVNALVQLMRRLRLATGVKQCSAHTFRRTFATSCLRNGMNIYILAKLMGHTDIIVLKKYLAIVEDDLSGAHDQHGPVDNM